MIRHQFGQVRARQRAVVPPRGHHLCRADPAAGLATPAKPAPPVSGASTSCRPATASPASRGLPRGLHRESSYARRAVEQEDLTRAAAILDGAVDRPVRGRRRARSRPSSTATARPATLARRAGERVLAGSATPIDGHRGRLQRRLPERHGGAGVRAERQAPARLRRARESRVPGTAPQPVAGTGTVQVSSAPRTRPGRCATCRWSSPRMAEPGRAVGVVGVLGPTRMAYAQAIGTVRFVSTLMNELAAAHLIA